MASVDAPLNMLASLVSGLALSSYDKDTFRGVRAVMELDPKDAVLVPGPRKAGTGRGAKSAEHSEAGSRSDDFASLSHVRGRCAPFLVRR